ncbi:hypothetical protein D3C81_1997140 [compost metagenome]
MIWEKCVLQWDEHGSCRRFLSLPSLLLIRSDVRWMGTKFPKPLAFCRMRALMCSDLTVTLVPREL